MPDAIDNWRTRAINHTRRTLVEWLAVIIASTAGVVSIVSMFIAAICVGVVIALNGRIEELADEIGVLKVRIENHEHRGHENE